MPRPLSIHGGVHVRRRVHEQEARSSSKKPGYSCCRRMIDNRAMPANLTPQYKQAEERYRSATTPDEKLEALREMMALLPKHKGTENLQADLRKRLAKLEH